MNWSLRWPLQPKLWPWVLQWLENHEWVQGCGITYRVLVAGLWGSKWGLLSFLGLLGWGWGVENLLPSFFVGLRVNVVSGKRTDDFLIHVGSHLVHKGSTIEKPENRQSKMKNPHEVFPKKNSHRSYINDINFSIKSTNLKTYGMSWRWRTFHHMAAF